MNSNAYAGINSVKIYCFMITSKMNVNAFVDTNCPQYAIFGRVTKGDETLQKLEQLPTRREGIFVMVSLRANYNYMPLLINPILLIVSLELAILFASLLIFYFCCTSLNF